MTSNGYVRLPSGIDVEDPMPAGEELPDEEILRGEKEALGFYFSQHPLASLAAEIRRITQHDTQPLKSRTLRTMRLLLGSSTVTGRSLQRGDRMASIMLEDTKGIVEAIIFPTSCQSISSSLRGKEPLVISGSVEKLEDGTTKIRAKQVAPLEENLAEMRKTVKVAINCQLFKRQELKKLKDVLHSIKGDSKVLLEFNLAGKQPLSLAELRIDASRLDVVTKQFKQGIAVEVLG